MPAPLPYRLSRQGPPPPDCHSRIIPITIEVDADTDYKPNAVVNCGPLIPDDATAATNPVIVVEVLSPGTKSVDTGAKLDGYFRVPSIASSGTIALDPPGIALDINEIYER
jgi:hypothetical protein